ncbi:MAG: LacI family DNA-binding transcriptional regulator [Planctomycetales bacterium]|nr:LacI family DNA-binding transcriptional regulator [Planctomycetales bacterium]
MSTIRKVAEDAGVSIATVSRVVNGSGSVNPDLRDRVMASVARCGYNPTVGRKTQGCIALVYMCQFTVDSPYDSAAFAGMVEAMQDSTFDLQIVNLRRDQRIDETFAQFCMRKGIEGAVIRCTAAERQIVAQMAEEEFPLVVLGDHFDAPGLQFAYNDSKAASQEAVEYLISLGHQRIAFAASDRDDGDHLDRLGAYQKVLAEHGLSDDRLIFKLPARQEDGTQLMRKMLHSQQPPTAVFIADPLVAVGAINEAHSLGVQIPESMSFVGFDDAELRHTVFPRMTAVCQDSRALGRRAFEWLAASVGGKSPSGVLHGDAWLEIHESTGPVAADGKPRLKLGGRAVSAGR